MCVILSILSTTYTLLDNVDASTDSPRRPDSGDTGDSEEQQEKPVEQESTDSDLTTKVVQGIGIGIISVVMILVILTALSHPRARDMVLGTFFGGYLEYCCIASSVTGTGMMTQVNFLRNYRERVVKKSIRGRRSLNIAEKIYYSMSPPIAKLDAKYEKFRLITRTFWSGPIVSLLLCGMLLFNSGRKEFIRLQKTDPNLTLKILTMGISSSIFATSWIIWNCYLVIALIYSGTLADIWQPAAGMLIGIASLLILRTLYSDLPILSDDTKLI